jgi:hypothetical protein
MPNNLKELAAMIAERDDISLNEAQILVDETQEEMERAFYTGSLNEVEDILADYLGLEPDYMMLFIN